MKKFELNDQDFIQLNQFLKLMGLVESGADAKNAILASEVLVNEKAEIQIRKKLRKKDTITYNGESFLIT